MKVSRGKREIQEVDLYVLLFTITSIYRWVITWGTINFPLLLLRLGARQDGL